MVLVAQLAERKVVALVVMGSNPIQHTEIINVMVEEHIELAKRFNYHPSLIRILEGCSEDELKEEYNDVYRNLTSCKYAKDKRSIIEYASDLINNWLFEDTIVDGLKQKGINIRLSGNDKNREILNQKMVGCIPDTIIEFQGQHVYMEIIRNTTNYWERTDNITSLRGKKLEHLVETKSLCLCVVTKNPKTYAIIDFAKDIKIGSPSVNEGIGGKIQTPISISENNIVFKRFNWTTMASDITSLMLSRINR